MKPLSSNLRRGAIAIAICLGLILPITVGSSLAASKVTRPAPVQETLDFLAQNITPKKQYKIAYLMECFGNPYCKSRAEAAQATAKRYGASLKLYDAGFNPATQLKQVQDALTGNFDGFIFNPVAETFGCKLFKMLQKSGKPIATGNSPMCGNQNYTPGTVGFSGFQTQEYFDEEVEYAFASCKTTCELAAIGGVPSFDVYRRWDKAVAKASKAHPNVKVVVKQAANWDAATAFKITQDALRAHPNISIIVSDWDDMTRGVIQAVQEAGKKPGVDITIFSRGGNAHGVADVKNGLVAATTIAIPREEGIYPVVHLIRYLETGKSTVGYTYLAYAPLFDAIGGIEITKANVAKYKAPY